MNKFEYTGALGKQIPALGGYVSKCMRAFGVYIGAGDVITLDAMTMGLVVACLCRDGAWHLVLRPMALVERLTPHSRRWSLCADHAEAQLDRAPHRPRCWYHVDECVITLD